MSHIIIITDRLGNEISVPGPHREAEPDHEPTTVVLDIEKVIELYNIKTKKDKDKDE